MKTTIYQVKDEHLRDYGFVSIEELEKCGKKVEPEVYEIVWSGELDTDDLEKIYYIFNCEIPEGFKGHSLSMSDVVVTENGAYFCDRFGFQKIEFTKKPKDKYEQLTEDVKEALAAAAEVAENEDDGGTCNFDTAVLFIKGCKRTNVIKAIENAGTRCFYNETWKGYDILPLLGGIANRRTVQAEKIEEVLKAKGYTMSIWYQMD